MVAAYHEAALGELVAHVAAAIDDFRNGDLDAFEVDRALLQYSRGAKELWKFCAILFQSGVDKVSERGSCATARAATGARRPRSQYADGAHDSAIAANRRRDGASPYSQ
jgi:hypothetical protein